MAITHDYFSQGRFSVRILRLSPKSLTMCALAGLIPRSTIARFAATSLSLAFSSDFTPVLAKHSKSFSLIDCISVGVDRMQRNFEPMRKQVEVGRGVN